MSEHTNVDMNVLFTQDLTLIQELNTAESLPVSSSVCTLQGTISEPLRLI